MVTYSNGPLTLDNAGPFVWTQPHTFEGDVTFNNPVFLNENVTIGSSGTDIITINGQVTTHDDVTFTDASIIQLTNTTTFTVNSATVTFGVTSAVTFSGGVTFASGGSVTFSTSNVQFNNDVTIGSSSADDLVVNAQSNFNAQVTFNEPVTLGSTPGDSIVFVGTPNFTQGTSATAGALQGYIKVRVNGTDRRIPYYAV